jgi:hypothetical protein
VQFELVLFLGLVATTTFGVNLQQSRDQRANRPECGNPEGKRANRGPKYHRIHSS